MEQHSSDKLIFLAAVASAHGIQGALKLRCFTEMPESVASYGPVFDKDGQKLFKLRHLGPCKGGIIVKAQGIDTRNQAEALKGLALYVPRSSLPDVDDDEFYFEDLIGLQAFDEDSPIGHVASVDDHGAAVVLEIENDKGDRIAVPFTNEHVPEVDLARGQIKVVMVLEDAA